MGPEMIGSMKGGGRGRSPIGMRIIFALMDTDSDGTVSLQEWQAAHERIFKAMDANKDGLLSLEEVQSFMRGASAPAPQLP
jgi:Ca2+-binding EF-hand superfamily protein